MYGLLRTRTFKPLFSHLSHGSLHNLVGEFEILSEIMTPHSTTEISDEIGRLLHTESTRSPLENRANPTYVTFLRALQKDSLTLEEIGDALKRSGKSLGFTDVVVSSEPNVQIQGKSGIALTAKYFTERGLELRIKLVASENNPSTNACEVTLNNSDSKEFNNIKDAARFIANVVGYTAYYAVN